MPAVAKPPVADLLAVVELLELAHEPDSGYFQSNLGHSDQWTYSCHLDSSVQPNKTVTMK